MTLGKSLIIFSFATCLLGLTSCLKHQSIAPVEEVVEDTTNISTVDSVSFLTDIMSEILTPSCNTAGCHNSSSAASGYDLTTYSNVNTNANIILSVIKHENGVTAMPLGGIKLDDSLATKMDLWIQQGKLNN